MSLGVFRGGSGDFWVDLMAQSAYTHRSYLKFGRCPKFEGAIVMAKRCQITGKTVMSGNNVSHAKNRTRRRFLPNLQHASMQSEILGRKISMRLSTSAMRTIEKHGGLDAFLLQARNAELADEAKLLKREIAAVSAAS